MNFFCFSNVFHLQIIFLAIFIISKILWFYDWTPYWSNKKSNVKFANDQWTTTNIHMRIPFLHECFQVLTGKSSITGFIYAMGSNILYNACSLSNLFKFLNVHIENRKHIETEGTAIQKHTFSWYCFTICINCSTAWNDFDRTSLSKRKAFQFICNEGKTLKYVYIIQRNITCQDQW